MMFMCNKQHLSNIWSWIHEKVKQHLKKRVADKKLWVTPNKGKKKLQDVKLIDLSKIPQTYQ